MLPWSGGTGTRRLGLPPPKVPLVIPTSQSLSVPPTLSLQSPHVAPAMGAPVVALLHSCGQSAQPFDPFFKQVGGHQCPPVGLPGLGKFMVIGIIIPQSSSRDSFLVVGCKCSGGSPFFISWYNSTPFHWRCCSMEDKMPQANSCTHSGPQGGGPGSLFSRYTSLYSPLISPWEVLYPTRWMVGTSTLGSSPKIPCQLPWQIAHSISFHPTCGVQEHSVEDEWVVASTSLPPWIFVKKQVCIQVPFHLCNGQPFTLCLPFGGRCFMPFVSILRLQ